MANAAKSQAYHGLGSHAPTRPVPGQAPDAASSARTESREGHEPRRVSHSILQPAMTTFGYRRDSAGPRSASPWGVRAWGGSRPGPPLAGACRLPAVKHEERSNDA